MEFPQRMFLKMHCENKHRRHTCLYRCNRHKPSELGVDSSAGPIIPSHKTLRWPSRWSLLSPGWCLLFPSLTITKVIVLK